MYSTFLSVIEEQLQQLSVQFIYPTSLYQPVHYSLESGGKRIRPILTMLACGSVGADPMLATNAGISLEILHNFTLVHDDIMDKSPLRRGKQTVYTKWDESTAILSGDAMMGVAYKIILSTTPNNIIKDVLQSYTDGFIIVCEGQALDIELRSRDSVQIDDYLTMIQQKTAQLLEIAVHIGGLFGGASESELHALQVYARSMGIGFQLQDDLLDLMATESEFGKIIGQDIVEGKKTYMIIRAHQKAEKAHHRKLIDDYYSQQGLPEEFVDSIRSMILELGIIDEVEERIDLYYKQASSALLHLPLNQYTEQLRDVLTMLSMRKK